jgi:hypothetical protein
MKIKLGEHMLRFKLGAVAAFALIIATQIAPAQDRETDIKKNVKLIEMPITIDLVADSAKQFLPILRDSIKEAVPETTDECALTLRVQVAVKEVGAAKIKRPMARITAYRKNSRQEFVGDFILYSFVNAGPVNKEETVQFLKKQILASAECH